MIALWGSERREVGVSGNEGSPESSRGSGLAAWRARRALTFRCSDGPAGSFPDADEGALAVRAAKGFPVLIQLLSHLSEMVVEQAAGAVRNGAHLGTPSRCHPSPTLCSRG